jgi:hypothetical protein
MGCTVIAGNLTHFLKGPVGTSAKNRPARLGDLPAFYDVTVNDLEVDKVGNLFVIEFAQPEAAGNNKKKLTEVGPPLQDWVVSPKLLMIYFFGGYFFAPKSQE